jgi:uncharacterized protein YqjF (DUF2071 family)
MMNSNSQPKGGAENRFIKVQMTLRDVLYVSYSLPIEKLRTFVPDVLSLATVGGDRAFISIVALQSTRVRLSLLPFTQFKYNQLNIRTYVVDPVSGKNAVYFLKSGVTSRFISLVTRMSGIPWQFIDLETEVNAQNEKDSYVASGNWEGKFSLRAQVFSNDSKNTLFFENRKAAVDFLIRPLIGFVGDGRQPGRFTIWHPEVKPHFGILTELDFPLFMNLGVVDKLYNPHSVFFLPMAEFSIYLPPRRIK